VFTIDLVLII